jgi:hypothetical protein
MVSSSDKEDSVWPSEESIMILVHCSGFKQVRVMMDVLEVDARGIEGVEGAL